MFHIRAPYVTPVIRPSRSVASVGATPASVKIGVAVPEPWVVVTTTMSRANESKNQDLKIGDVVRFTVQYGLRPREDNSNLIVVRGKIVSPRTPILPDSYGVEAQEVALTHDLDPSLTLPYVGQIFLVAPWSIAEVESSTPAPVPGESAPAPETPAEPPTPSPDETTGKDAAPEASKPAASPPPPPPPGASPLPTQPVSAGSNTALYVGLGAAALALVGLGTWYFWPVA